MLLSLLAFTVLAHASPACPQLAGTWDCPALGAPGMGVTIAQSETADGRTVLEVTAPSFPLSFTITEGVRISEPSRMGALGLAEFSCNDGVLNGRQLMTRIAAPSEVPAEILKGQDRPAGPSTIWGESTYELRNHADGTVEANLVSHVMSQDPAVKGDVTHLMPALCTPHRSEMVH